MFLSGMDATRKTTRLPPCALTLSFFVARREHLNRVPWLLLTKISRDDQFCKILQCTVNFVSQKIIIAQLFSLSVAPACNKKVSADFSKGCNNLKIAWNFLRNRKQQTLGFSPIAHWRDIVLKMSQHVIISSVKCFPDFRIAFELLHSAHTCRAIVAEKLGTGKTSSIKILSVSSVFRRRLHHLQLQRNKTLRKTGSAMPPFHTIMLCCLLFLSEGFSGTSSQGLFASRYVIQMQARKEVKKYSLKLVCSFQLWSRPGYVRAGSSGLG